MLESSIMRGLSSVFVAATLVACAQVRPQDTEAWVGQPVNVLEKQPYFLTMPVVKTHASDGTDIWNYVSGQDVSSCSQNGALWGRWVGWGMYSGFTSCVARHETCNNIFYIRNDRVQRVVVMPTAGALCSTDARFLPSFSG